MLRNPAVFWSLGLAACAPQLPPPLIEAVVEDHGFNGEDTLVRIVGTNFYPQLDLDGQGSVDGSVQAWLTQNDAVVPLLDVVLESYSEVAAVVPAGLAEGPYEVVLALSADREATLADAFDVRGTPADALHVEGPGETTLGGVATIALTLVDSHGLLVPEDVPLYIEVLNGPEVLLCPKGCLEKADVGSSHLFGVMGGGTGEATLSLANLDEPGLVTLAISTINEELSGIIEPVIHTVTFTPRQVESVALELLDPMGEIIGGPVEAGEPLRVQATPVDETGAVLAEANGTLAFIEACGGAYMGTLDLQGITEIQGVSLNTATDSPNCESNGILAFGQVGGLVLDGTPVTKAPISVLPGPMAAFSVLALNPEFSTGTDPLGLLVTAEDRLGNVVTDHQSEVTVDLLEAGTDQVALEVAEQTCTSFSSGLASCSVRTCPGDSGPTVVARVQDDVFSGESASLLPNAGPAIGARLTSAVAMRNTPFEVSYEVIGPAGHAAFTEANNLGWSTSFGAPISCTRVGAVSTVDGVLYTHSCVVDTAGQGTMQVSYGAMCLEVDADLTVQ